MRVHPWILLETVEYHRMSSRQISHPWIRSAFCSLKDLMVPSDRRSVNALVSEITTPNDHCRCCAEDFDKPVSLLRWLDLPYEFFECFQHLSWFSIFPTEHRQLYPKSPSHWTDIHSIVEDMSNPVPNPYGLFPISHQAQRKWTMYLPAPFFHLSLGPIWKSSVWKNRISFNHPYPSK